jgi:ATP-dependent DNA helicase RecG
MDKDIEPINFEEFRIAAGLSPALDNYQIIRNLKLTLPDTTFKNGGVLFFASSPESFFEKAVIRCVAFEGISKTQIIDDKVYGGPLMSQYKQSMHWLKDKLDIRYEIEGSVPREEIWEIPETAFKEAIINALTHRHYYDKGARTTVELFRDRVEITNPGGLVSAISPKDFGTKSHSRNPLILGLFERIDMVEQIGSGISRIRDEVRKSGLPLPEFKTEGMFIVFFRRPVRSVISERSGKIREKTREKIIRGIQKNDSITTAELAAEVGITEKGIEYHLSKLKADRVIKRAGPDKGGKWVIIGEQE